MTAYISGHDHNLQVTGIFLKKLNINFCDGLSSSSA